MPHVPGDGNTVRASHSQSIHISFGAVVGSLPAMFISHGSPIMIEVVHLVWFHNLAEASSCFRALHKTCKSMFVAASVHIQELAYVSNVSDCPFLLFPVWHVSRLHHEEIVAMVLSRMDRGQLGP